MRRFLSHLVAVVAVFASAATAWSAEGDAAQLAKDLGPIWSCLSGSQRQFCLTGKVQIAIEGKAQDVEVRLVRYDDQSFDLEAKHADYWVQLRRRDKETAFALPLHKIVYLGRGDVADADSLAPAGIIKRIIGKGTTVSMYSGLLDADSATASLLLTGFLNAKYDSTAKTWSANKDASFQFSDNGRTLDLKVGQSQIHLALAEKMPTLESATAWSDLKVVELKRSEIERQFSRGVARACEILAPSKMLTSPEQIGKKVEHGELRWIEGQRVVLLEGTPEQIGMAHGQLLKAEANRCIDSVLYSFGTVQTIRTGRWFREDLESAYKRLSPHIPENHKRETKALAESLGIDPQLAQTINVFPELFHCSGFALFGKATKDGKLYHGRVLDYMTTIGLQDSATTFIVAVEGKIPFANVGYAGFIGSVSGMNAKAISLGEMGGHGEGEWDGVPMATLMRRALEECSTLDDVMTLWKTSPRTCEYFYVFADGKTNQAVGVSATPQAIEFIHPGQSHPRLGEGIEDSVVLSAGGRLEKLRERVKEKYGKVDVDGAQWLMCRPVAMESNLHNVLFVPADGVFYVANADHKHPAAERPYVKLDLKALLGSMKGSQEKTAAK